MSVILSIARIEHNQIRENEMTDLLIERSGKSIRTINKHSLNEDYRVMKVKTKLKSTVDNARDGCKQRCINSLCLFKKSRVSACTATLPGAGVC